MMNALDRPTPAADVEPEEFRTTLRQLAGAVSVVTAGRGDDRSGLTATSVTSFSAEPPAVLVAVNLRSSALPAIRAYRHFAVNVLNAGQQPLADRFAGRDGLRGAARFQGSDWASLVTGAPVLVGALAVIDAELEEVIERHSHALLIGRVKAVASDGQAGALLYWRGDYACFDDEPSDS